MNETPVIITDLRIPFWRLVLFFVKVSIAAIPATIIVTSLMALVYLAVAAVFIGATGGVRL